MGRAETGRTDGAGRPAPDPTHVPPPVRTSPAERVAIVVVLTLALISGAGIIGYGLSHAALRVAPVLGAGAGGPPVTDATGEPTSPTGTTAPTARTSTSARPGASRSSTPPAKVVIPESAAPRYRANTVTAGTPAGRGRVITFDVHVQKGLPYAVDQIAPQLAATLNDPRSWRANGRQRFRLVTHDAELHAYLVTPDTTDRLCRPLLTQGEVSCQQGDKVVLNAKRWAFAVPEFAGDIPLYRQYLVNHEFGHYLGYGHVGCPGKGRAAPVMMQQTKGLGGCRANAWPYPKR